GRAEALRAGRRWEEDEHVVDRLGVLERVERELERLAAKHRHGRQVLVAPRNRAVLAGAAEDEDRVLALRLVELEVAERRRLGLGRDPDRLDARASGEAADPDAVQRVAAGKDVAAADV